MSTSVSRRLPLFGLLVLASCDARCSAGGTSPEQLAAQIRAELQERAGVSVEVTCPALDPERDDRCSATAPNGETFSIDVRRGSDGDWSWESRGVAFGEPLAATMQAFYAEQHGITFSKIVCPAIVVQQGGDSVECKAHERGIEVIFRVAMGPERASFEPRRGFVVPALAAKLAVDELARLNIRAEVDCGSTLRLSVPGSTFTCTARDSNGDTRPLYYQVTDDDGGIRVQSRPF